MAAAVRQVYLNKAYLNEACLHEVYRRSADPAMSASQGPQSSDF
jgi:hypothetical protein